MMELRFFLIAICLSIAINSCKKGILTVKDINMLKLRIIECIASDLEQDTALCEFSLWDNNAQRVGFYTAELEEFPLKDALSEIVDIYLEEGFTDRDFFGISMLYPLVGFDPSIGYQFSIILYDESLDRAIYVPYSYDSKTFKRIRKNQQELEMILSSSFAVENGCGTGYFLYYYSSFDFQNQGCVCAYDLGD